MSETPYTDLLIEKAHETAALKRKLAETKAPVSWRDKRIEALEAIVCGGDYIEQAGWWGSFASHLCTEKNKLVSELDETRAKLKTAVEALEYYAAQPPQHAYYIVEAKDRSFISDMADWGIKAQDALAAIQAGKDGE